MSYKDVREWIQKVDQMGELTVIEGADWNLEIGALTVLASNALSGSRPADRPGRQPVPRRGLSGTLRGGGR
jgi:hypothetical protein